MTKQRGTEMLIVSNFLFRLSKDSFDYFEVETAAGPKRVPEAYWAVPFRLLFSSSWRYLEQTGGSVSLKELQKFYAQTGDFIRPALETLPDYVLRPASRELLDFDDRDGHRKFLTIVKKTHDLLLELEVLRGPLILFLLGKSSAEKGGTPVQDQGEIARPGAF